MATPTFNKYRSTTIFGNLSVRDLTNSSGSSVIEVASIDLSGNFLSRGDSTFTKAVVCNALLADINANNKLTTKEYVDNAVGGGGGVSLAGTNNFTGFNTYNTNFPTSTLPTSTSITNDSIVNKGMLDTIYQTIANMSNYLTTATASSTYQTIANMSNYLTTASASTTYSTITNQVKTNTANAFTSTNTFNTNLPTSTLMPSLSTELTTKQYVDSVSSGASLSGNNTFTGLNVFNNCIKPNYSIIGADNTTLTLPAVVEYNIVCTTASYNKLNQTDSKTTNINQILINDFSLPANHIAPLDIVIPVSLTYTSTLTTETNNQSINSNFTISNYYFDIYINGSVYESVLAVEEYSQSKVLNCLYTTTANVSAVSQTTNYFFTTFYLNNYVFPINSTTKTIKVVFRVDLNASVFKTTFDSGNFYGFSVSPTLNINNTTIWRTTSSGTAPLPTITQQPYSAVSGATTTITFTTAQPTFIRDGTKFIFSLFGTTYSNFTIGSRRTDIAFESYDNTTLSYQPNTTFIFSSFVSGSYNFTLVDATANNNTMNYMGSLQFQYLMPMYDSVSMTQDHIGYVYNNTTWTNQTNRSGGFSIAQMFVPKTKSTSALWLIEANISFQMNSLSLTLNRFQVSIPYRNSNFAGGNGLAKTAGIENIYVPTSGSTLTHNYVKTFTLRPNPTDPMNLVVISQTPPNTYSFTFSSGMYFIATRIA